jgi:hypothetical protein
LMLTWCSRCCSAQPQLSCFVSKIIVVGSVGEPDQPCKVLHRHSNQRGGMSARHLSSDHGCLACCVQVAAELGYPYEDQEFVLEPDHGQWAEDIAFEGAKDDANFGECSGAERGGGAGHRFGSCLGMGVSFSC